MGEFLVLIFVTSGRILISGSAQLKQSQVFGIHCYNTKGYRNGLEERRRGEAGRGGGGRGECDVTFSFCLLETNF